MEMKNMTSILPHAWPADMRSPAYSIDIGMNTFNFYPMSYLVWLEYLLAATTMALVAAVTAIPVYYMVARKPRSLQAYVVGLGLLLPFWIIFPEYLIGCFDIKHKVIRFTIAVITPTCSMFRITEAAFGFAPHYVMTSLGQYCLYFGSPLLHKYNYKLDKFEKGTIIEAIKHLQRFAMYLVIISLFQSCFQIFPNFFPTFSVDKGREYLFHPETFYTFKYLKDAALYAILYQGYLTTFSQGLMALTIGLTGRKPEKIMDNPMFASTSPSDFWGRRWNLLIHRSLKNGVYKPVRYLGGSSTAAIVASFIASGLFHERILPLVQHDADYVLGTNLLFFLWQAGLVAMEAFVADWPITKTISQSLPRPVKTLCIILLGLPPAHFFCDAYVKSDFFIYGGTGLFLITRTIKSA